MKTSFELYGKQDGNWFCICSYQPILESFGEIVLQVDDDDYQGDSRVIYRDGDRRGWLQFGWGSCSGCDCLQGCESHEEVDKLINDLHGSIKWFDSLKLLKQHFDEKDWEAEYSWHEEEQAKFIRGVMAL